MAKKNNYKKKAVKSAKKLAKKNPTAFVVIVVLLIVALAAGAVIYFMFIRTKDDAGTSSSELSSSEVISSNESESEHSHSHEPISTEKMNIHFLELGNKYTGDSTYIKAGDVDILIDAGSRQSSAETIKTYVDQYCTDGKLEYVIATHAHQDHIAGFVGTTKIPGIFEAYKIDTLIDFSYTNNDGKSLYESYISKRNSKIESGDIAHHYTAEDCVKEENGAKKVFTIADGITMTILDQKFYHEETFNDYKERKKTIDENDFSVCALFSHGENHYLFTGDLEKEGEESLVELNELPHCQLFKGGHHGSPTSNNDCLLSKITPENVCICCCAGHDEYTKDPRTQFPSKAAYERISAYTDNIYVTTVSPDGHSNYESMNGNITFKCEDGVNYVITGSNNSTKLKDTAWFIERQKLWEEEDKA